MENYYLGAYRLVKLRPLDFGTFNGETKLSSSCCVNYSCYDTWTLPWTVDGRNPKAFELSKNRGDIEEIQEWADAKFNTHKLGWCTSFFDYETLVEYAKFWGDDCVALAVLFSEDAKNELIDRYDLHNPDTIPKGNFDVLVESIPENKVEGDVIGFELIGPDGNLYHSHLCYSFEKELRHKFDIELNEYGLIPNEKKKGEIERFANDESESGLPYLGWYLTKIKLINIKAEIQT